MSTGRPPVRGDSTLAILRRVGEEQPIPFYDTNETMPLWLDRLVQRFLEKQVDARISNAQDAVELLRASLVHARAPARNPLPQVLHERTRTKKKRVIVYAVLIVAIILVATLTRPASQFTSTNEHVVQPSPSGMSTVHQVMPTLTDEMTFDSDLPNRLLKLETKGRDLKASLETE